MNGDKTEVLLISLKHKLQQVSVSLLICLNDLIAFSLPLVILVCT